MSAESQGSSAPFRSRMTCTTLAGPVGTLFVLLIVAGTVAACGPSGTSRAGGISFDRPAAMALDDHADIYVADGGNSRIVVLSPKGKIITTWSTNPRGYGCDDAPDNVGVDPRHHVFVWAGGFCQDSNSSNYPHKRIMEFSARGRLLHTWSQDTVSIALASPHGLYVCRGPFTGPSVRHPPRDYCGGENDAIDAQGSLTLDADGKYYSTNNAGLTGRTGWADAPVTKFSPAGTVLANYGDWQQGDVNHNSGVPGEFRFNDPLSITVDRRGILYITDDNATNDATGYHAATKGSVISLSPQGRTLAVWARFQSPVALAVDPESNVYVLDAGANQLTKLSPRGRVMRAWGG